MLSFWKAPVWIVVAITTVDQMTKALVRANWSIGTERVVIPGFFYLVHYRNPGAAWGMLRQFPHFLGILSIGALTFLIWRFSLLASGSRFRGGALALIAGGICGNLIDRVILKEVVDFLLFDLVFFRWPAFNVADSAICVGVGAFVLSSFLHPEEIACSEEAESHPTAHTTEES